MRHVMIKHVVSFAFTASLGNIKTTDIPRASMAVRSAEAGAVPLCYRLEDGSDNEMTSNK